ncbi:hypothetical protein AAVH_05959 [Aphelenchoides avenae]|nr:hypothetical protein AAVH_05959 [Aphelenchus avenae]
MLFTAIDRLFAVLFPIKYTGMGARYALGLMLTAYACSTPTFLYCIINSFFGFPPGTLVSIECDGGTAWNGNTMDYVRIQRCTCTMAGTLLYAPILVRVLKVTNHRQAVHLRAKKFIRTTVTVSMITASHFVLLAVPDILYFIMPNPAVPLKNVLKNMITSQGTP